MLARKALAGTAGAPKVYVEDVFSTYLYTGNASTQTITNNIDISGKGGLVWTKSRSNATGHILFDTERGLGTSGNRPDLHTELTSAQVISGEGISSFNSDGYTLENTVSSNGSARTFVSWTFRKAKKFFDVVTYTGNGSNRTISHNLGSTPGCIIVKRTDATAGWPVYHRSIGATQALELQITNAAFSSSSYWNNTEPTSTVFTVGTDSYVNANGGTYVAYLFAHDAGGFGDAGSDNVISCGSYTGNGSTSGPTVTLGYEPQWVLIKRATGGTANWFLVDNMRGLPVGGSSSYLLPNTSDGEQSTAVLNPTATGFQLTATGVGINGNGDTYTYIAIRRGPMKTPTSGTSVFTPVSTSGNVSEITAGFPVDFALGKEVKNGTSYGNYAIDRLRGGARLSETNTTGAEYTGQTFKFDSNTKFLQGGTFYGPSIYWLMRRAPGFFDVVCYTGTGSNLTVAHNLGVVPELIIAKNRTTAGNNWPVLFNFTSTNSSYAFLNLTSAGGNDTYANVGVMTAQPTSTNLYLSSSGSMNTNGNNHVAYLFASVSGVSKVGSFNNAGSDFDVNCGFTNGARFVLVKRYSSTGGGWFVFDSARGIVAGNDPLLGLNSTAAEDTSGDYIDTYSQGFRFNGSAFATGDYIFLAIA